MDGSRWVFRSEDEPWSSLAEVAGYNFSAFLKSDLAIPTYEATLSKDDFLSSKDWPWAGSTRSGTLQRYVKTKKTTAMLIEKIAEKDASDVEVISFILGRYDNHDGNLLITESGKPVLIDFEGALQFQKGRFGEFPFVQVGGFYKSEADQAKVYSGFPFDIPYLLRN